MNRLWKRLFDCTVAITVMVSFAPVFLLIALAIKLTSTGPALFLQERIGRYGRSFRIVKFRSMAQDVLYLRNADGSAFSSDADPRVTRIGRFLRYTSLDELPQLWNVLRGEMSLIGPRPELPEGTCSYLAAHFRRLNVRPGMTGWAVVHGRNNVPVSIRRDLDTWYADHAGSLLDFKILGKTIAIVLRGRGINRGSDSPPAHTLSSECAPEPERCPTEN